jgi:hypothetical protein
MCTRHYFEKYQPNTASLQTSLRNVQAQQRTKLSARDDGVDRQASDAALDRMSEAAASFLTIKLSRLEHSALTRSASQLSKAWSNNESHIHCVSDCNMEQIAECLTIDLLPTFEWVQRLIEQSRKRHDKVSKSSVEIRKWFPDSSTGDAVGRLAKYRKGASPPVVLDVDILKSLTAEFNVTSPAWDSLRSVLWRHKDQGRISEAQCKEIREKIRRGIKLISGFLSEDDNSANVPKDAETWRASHSLADASGSFGVKPLSEVQTEIPEDRQGSLLAGGMSADQRFVSKS